MPKRCVWTAIAAGSSSIVVNTTAVSAKSDISTFDASKGSLLDVTCSTSPQPPFISAITAGTSFTISVAANFTTNPGCTAFHIKN